MKREKIDLRESVENLVRLLYSAINSPHLHAGNAGFMKALETQIGLARYEDEEEKIASTTINTFKKICSSLGEGFEGVDTLRKKALKTLRDKGKKPKKKPDSRRSKLEKEKHQQNIIGLQDKSLLHLTAIILALKWLSKELVTLDLQNPKAYYDKEIARIDSMLQNRRY